MTSLRLPKESSPKRLLQASLVAQTSDAVEKLPFDWDRASKRDQKCLFRSPRSLITRLIATFSGQSRTGAATEFFNSNPAFVQ